MNERKTFYIDGGVSVGKKEVNRFGKVKEGQGASVGAVADEKGKLLVRKFNGKCEGQIEREMGAFLVLVNYVQAKKHKNILIKSDLKCINQQIKSKRNSLASKYQFIAFKILKENNVKFDFEWVESAKNLADKGSRPVTYLN